MSSRIKTKIIRQLSIGPATNNELAATLGYAYSSMARFTKELADERRIKAAYSGKGATYSIMDPGGLRFAELSMSELLARVMSRAVEQGTKAPPFVRAVATYGTFVADLNNDNPVSLADFPERCKVELESALEQTKLNLAVIEQLLSTEMLWDRTKVMGLVDGPAFAKLARDCHGELRI